MEPERNAAMTLDDTAEVHSQPDSASGTTNNYTDTETAIAAPPPAPPAALEHPWPQGVKLASILAAVVTAYFLVFFDIAIVSTVTPPITSEFNSLVDIGWYSSAYTLASSAFQPLSGNIYRHFSIKWSFLIFLFVFEVGSALCGAAQSSTMFIIGRAIAGLGSAGIFTGNATIVANVLPAHRRPRIMGINMGIGQMGFALGPILGGAFASGPSWRWIFYLNLFLGIPVAGGMLFNKVPEAAPKLSPRQVLGTAVKSLDLGGFLLVSPAAVMLLLALEYGGSQYAWNSSVVIGLMVGAVVTFALFFLWERSQSDHAMVPFAMLRHRVIRSATLTSFFSVPGILIADYYLAIYFQAILNDSALMSGVHLLPKTMIMVVSTILTGTLTQKTGYYLPWIMLGSALSAIGYGLLSTLTPTTSVARWAGYQILIGTGIGASVSGPMLAVQNIVALKQMPKAVSIVLSMQNMGSAIWLVVANTIFNNELRQRLQQSVDLIGLDPSVVISAGARSIRDLGLNDAGVSAVVQAYTDAIDRTMYLGVAVVATTFLFNWGLGLHNIHTVKREEIVDKKAQKKEEASKA
ncbi:putative mfs transporter protein [Phaeoacremonium minimum UCRPA7]|uniref:Putative mfs transporter protein n=1 Tax=Phaeoacremonium minimum (strain UCR-PA7) TaxID=1286976 RepID=R8BTA7_PHAM7|nr:putative mfs transporter protein [Phaeoacremonium minimum UCRPA7]EOO02505.1 putative mfs transporter protein [Phaeoacremonium minimum UCRPA7]